MSSERAMNQKLGKRKRRLQEQAAPATAKAATSRRYFHGGRAGFKAILPPSVSGAGQNGVVPDSVSTQRSRVHHHGRCDCNPLGITTIFADAL
jgi:hypothetical protein